MEIVIVTGLSGAGKTQAANALEDIGYFCIDNMPPSLIPRFAEMALQLNKYSNVAVVTDVRTGTEFFGGFFDAVEDLKKLEVNVRILFIDASDEVIAKRYRETRRKHPLANSDVDVLEAIRDERAMLRPIFELSDYHIVTTYISPTQMKDQIMSLFSTGSSDSLYVRCMSFGYKYGVPTEADLMLDVRCLPNPFYVDELKDKNGLDSEVKEYVFGCAETQEMRAHSFSLVDFLLPLYVKEGKSQLVIAIGCTGGKHRSVTLAEDLSDHVKSLGYKCKTIHRDIAKLI